MFAPFSKYGIRVSPQCQRHLKKTHVFLSTVSCPAVCLCICSIYSICICMCVRYCVVCDLFSFVSNYAQCLPFPNMVTTALVRLAGLNWKCSSSSSNRGGTWGYPLKSAAVASAAVGQVGMVSFNYIYPTEFHSPVDYELTCCLGPGTGCSAVQSLEQA